MAFRQLPVAAALALALVCSPPAETAPDRYQDRATDSHHFPQKESNADSDARTFAKRELAMWSGQQALLPGYERFSMWKPPVYQLSRPYFIPIYGAAGRVPIYFPPQKLNLNPGAPADNPLPFQPYSGPSYLPPKEYPATTTTTEKPMKINDRFDDDDDDDRPVWGMSEESTPRPNIMVPTRPPRPASTTDFPPLVHDANSGSNFLNVADRKESDAPPKISRPAPAAGPSNCAWAIVSCCSAASAAAPAGCFEQRGCPGPFWGPSPCESDYARAAIQSALQHFG